MLLVLCLGVAVHLLLPEVGELPRTLQALEAARWEWLALGLVVGTSGYLAAAAAQLGAVEPAPSLGRTVLVQVATSFVNAFTPAGLGGIGVNVRYLQRSGLDRPAATAAVAATTAAGIAVHLVGLLVAVTLLGPGWAAAGDLPRSGPVLLAVSGTLALCGLVLWSPAGRRRLLHPGLRAARDLAGVLHRPSKAALLFGGSAGVTLSYALALASCDRAFDVHVSLPGTVAVYLAATAIASIAPVPGGLGATEASLVAGLTAAGASTGPAIAGVLAFRLVTYWLPILPGWLAHRALRADGTI